MKITNQQLTLNLKHALAPLYLITGDDYFLVREALDSIVIQAQKMEFTDCQRLYVESHYDWHQFSSEVNNLSLFNERKIIELFLQATITESGNKTLAEYAAKPNPNNLLILIAEKLDATTQKKAWYKAIEQHGTIVQIWPLEATQLPTWILQRAKNVNLKLDLQASSLIADYCNGNLFAAAQEIEKLSLIYGTNPISTEELITSITDNSRFTIFNLVDQALLGNKKQVINILSKLENDGTEPTLILWSLTRELRQLIRILQHQQTGKTLEQAMQSEKAWISRKAMIKTVLARQSLENLEKILANCFQLDLIIKGGKPGIFFTELLDTIKCL